MKFSQTIIAESMTELNAQVAENGQLGYYDV